MSDMSRQMSPQSLARAVLSEKQALMVPALPAGTQGHSGAGTTEELPQPVQPLTLQH